MRRSAQKYFISGEINTKMPDHRVVQEKLDALAARYSDAKVYSMDGTSVEYPDWHFNVRASNTEPLIRLNLEATTAAGDGRKSATKCWGLSGLKRALSL